MENNKPLMNLETKKYMERELKRKEERMTSSTEEQHKERKITRSLIWTITLVSALRACDNNNNNNNNNDDDDNILINN